MPPPDSRRPKLNKEVPMLAKTKMKAADLDSSRQDVAAAQAALDEILSRELEATDSPAIFAAWRAERDAAISEVDRLTKLVARLEAAAGADERATQEAEIAKRANDQRRTNEALAARIKTEGGPAIEKLLALAREVATAAVVDAAINAKLPDDAEKIVSADMQARHRPPLPRETVSERTVTLWVFAATGNVIGNQGDVTPIGDGSTGFIRSSPQQYKTRVFRRKFKSITYLEAESYQPLVPFFEALRLPFSDGPGLVWNPRDGLSTATAVEILKRGPAVAERGTLTELVPIEPFVPQREPASWGRAGDI
jgi:hypothetical protein